MKRQLQLFVSIFILLFACSVWAESVVYYADATAADQGAAGTRTIKGLVTAIGATKNATIVLAHTSGSTTTTYTVGTNLTISSNITLKVDRGAVVAIATAKTLTINGQLEGTGDFQIFSLTGTGAVAGLKESNVIWFGADPDGETDNDEVGIKAAFASVIAGGKVIIPLGPSFYSYDNDSGLTDAVAITQAVNVELNGIIKSTSSANQASPPYIFNVTGDNFHLYGSGTLQGPGTWVVDEATANNRPGLLKISGDYPVIDGITFVDPPEQSIYLVTSDYAKIVNCLFTGGPTDAEATDPQHYHIMGYGGNNHIISNNQFLADSGGGAPRQAITYGGVTVTGLSITDNIFISMHEHAVYCYTTHSIVSDNYIYESAGIKLHGEGNTVTGNHLNFTNGGIEMNQAYDTVVADNNIMNHGKIGISVSDNYANTTGYNRVIISGNVVTGDRTGTYDIYGGIRFVHDDETTVDSYGPIITDNYIYNSGNAGVTAYTPLRVSGYGSNYVLYADISNNKIVFPKKHSFYLGNLKYARVSGNTIFEPQTATSYGFYLDGVTYSTFDGNIATDYAATPKLSRLMYVSGAANNYIEMINNGVFTTGTVATLGLNATYNVKGRGNRLSETDRLTGTFTMNNVASLVVANTNIEDTTTTSAVTTVHIFALNAAAATVMGSTKALYVSAKVAKTSFTVATADASNVAASNAIFGYEIVQ